MANDGKVHTAYEDLEQYMGIARKSILLLINEGLNYPWGIATDTHVMNVMKAIGLFIPPPDLTSDKSYANHVELSLRSWAPCGLYTDLNKVPGSCAQHWTQDMTDINRTKEGLARLSIACGAMRERFFIAYHVHILFFVMSRIITFYAEVKLRAAVKPAPKKDATPLAATARTVVTPPQDELGTDDGGDDFKTPQRRL